MTLGVPAFLPAFRKFRKPAVAFSIIPVLQREYSGWLAAAFGFLFIDLLRKLFHGQALSWDQPSLMVFYIMLLITLVLRTIRHHTRLLEY